MIARMLTIAPSRPLSSPLLTIIAEQGESYGSLSRALEVDNCARLSALIESVSNAVKWAVKIRQCGNCSLFRGMENFLMKIYGVLFAP